MTKENANFAGDGEFFARSLQQYTNEDCSKAKLDSLSAAHIHSFLLAIDSPVENPPSWHYKQNPLKLPMSKPSGHEISAEEHYAPFHLTH